MQRNHGISLLRLVLMFLIVILHILGQGGILGAVAPMSAKYGAAWFLEALGNCAANCYALISGYVYINNKYKFSSLIQIWLQTLLYSVGIALCLWIVRPEYFSLRSLQAFLFPVSTEVYWYVTAYVGLFVLIPVLNGGIHALSEKQARMLMLGLFLIYSLLPTVMKRDIFLTKYGYSTLWLAYMYIIGACMKKHSWGDSLKAYQSLLLYLGCSLVTLAVQFGKAYTAAEPASGGIDYIYYTTPAMVIAAVSLFLLFKNASIPSRWVRLISQLSPAAFGVYLIHEHDYIRGHFLVDRFRFLTQYSLPVMVAGILAAALVIFTVCLAVDWVRCRVFRLLGVKEHLEKWETAILRRFGL